MPIQKYLDRCISNYIQIIDTKSSPDHGSNLWMPPTGTNYINEKVTI